MVPPGLDAERAPRPVPFPRRAVPYLKVRSASPAATRRPAVRRLPPMLPDMPPPGRWALQRHDGTIGAKRDGCWHCRNNPGYLHSDWEPVYDEPPPRKPDGPVWRFWYWVYGDWGIGRRAASREREPGTLYKERRALYVRGPLSGHLREYRTGS